MIWDFNDNMEPLDRWGQAKYAMEVFAAMLQKNDTMRVYYMSDFISEIGGSLNARPAIDISGSMPTSERVAVVHDTIPHEAHGTPFDPVIKAHADLRDAVADEKWLVVLTDGVFNRIYGNTVREGSIDVDDYFDRYARDNISIIYLAIGDDIVEIRANPNRHIYFEHARNSNEILGKITSICNRIFKRSGLRLTARHELTFDVPMVELLVLAQGPNVRINDISGNSVHSPSEEPVNVQYGRIPVRNIPNNRPAPKISEELTGVVAVFRDIPKGRYSMDVTGEQTVDIYYQPAVNIAIRLSQRGRQVRSEDITEGNYQIRFGFADENGRFFESPLLGSVEYEATIQNDGQTISIKYGDTINIKEGNFTIYVRAHFLGYNTAENSRTGNVYPPPTLREILLDILRQFWFIFALLLALLLYWILWGRKNRFPSKRQMSRNPVIQEEINGNVVIRNGRFTIDTKTIWLPFCAEKGTIKAVPTERTLPRLKVRAIDRNIMELYNAEDFSPEHLHDAEVTISGRSTEGVGNSMVISCKSTIEVTYRGRDGAPNEVYTCYL
jgi:hypothetical protein